METFLQIWIFLWLLSIFEYFLREPLLKVVAETTPQFRLNCIKVSRIFFWGSLIILVWLAAIKKAQFAPHVITQSINGKVINQFTTTNPAYVTFTEDFQLETNGLGLRRVAVTNYYWNQWSIFKSK